MEVIRDDCYGVIDTRLKRYSLKGEVYSFVNFVRVSSDLNYTRTRELVARMREEEFERLVARYKLETSE